MFGMVFDSGNTTGCHEAGIRPLASCMVDIR